MSRPPDILIASFGQLRTKMGTSNHWPLSYFQHFEGHQDCGIVSTEIYEPPTGEFRYCKSRAALLEALTGGGRHGFDTPFFPNGNGVFSYSLPPSGTQRAIALALRSSLYPGTTSPANITPGCHYRWFTTAEICMILERFDAIIFLGDNMVRSIYSAFNILLRENAALGALKQWEMSDAERSACRCDNQFAKGECAMFAATRNEEVAKNDGGGKHSSPYFCDRELMSRSLGKAPVVTPERTSVSHPHRHATHLPPPNHLPFPFLHLREP
jgi:hypothetical protein